MAGIDWFYKLLWRLLIRHNKTYPMVTFNGLGSVENMWTDGDKLHLVFANPQATKDEEK